MTSETPNSRPTWREYYLGVATAVASRGDCRRTKVGAVLVTRDHVGIFGYNGVDPGQDGCLAGACPRGLLTHDELASGGDYANCIATHAEANALRKATETVPNKIKGSTVYVTREPCSDCTKLLKWARVQKVIWPDGEIRLSSA